jgi:phenylacetate-CoA ligase
MKRAWSRKNLWEGLPAPLRATAGAVLRALPPHRLLGKRFRDQLNLAREAEWWPAERWRSYQVEQLRRICTLAAKTPFYQEAFASAGFDPRDICEPEDLAGLPLIDKTVVIERGAEMCRLPAGDRGVDSISTGGSTGAPLHFLIDANRSAAEYAHLVVSWERAGYDLAIPQAVIRGQVVGIGRDGLRHSYDPVLRRHYYSNFHTSDHDLARYFDHIARIGPCYLHVYPSSAAVLARYLERTGRRAPVNIRGILAGSENVYPQERANVERAFGVRYFSWYGHSEKLVLAAECEHSSDYHVWPTYGLCELVDDAGRPVRTPGQRGEIVGTGFINTVMPFIRYRTGDYATYVGRRCAVCGREQPILRDIVGHRTHEMLIAADGGLISWTAINMHDDTFAHVGRFQFRQDEPGVALLMIVPAPGFSEGDLKRIRANVNAKLAGRIRFEIATVPDVALTHAGKCTYVDQRLDLAALEPVSGSAG